MAVVEHQTLGLADFLAVAAVPVAALAAMVPQVLHFLVVPAVAPDALAG